MIKNALKTIEQIEMINEYIEDECQEYLFYTPGANRRIFERIKNASDMLLNNAMRVLRNQSPIIATKQSNLNLENTKNLMFKMYQELKTSDFPIIKENKIRKMMQDEFQLNPNELLLTYPKLTNTTTLEGTVTI